MNHHWKTVGFGDGFAALIDPTDATLGYSIPVELAGCREQLPAGPSSNIASPRPAAEVAGRMPPAARRFSGCRAVSP
jgi:hypothetical protein